MVLREPIMEELDTIDMIKKCTSHISIIKTPSRDICENFPLQRLPEPAWKLIMENVMLCEETNEDHMIISRWWFEKMKNLRFVREVMDRPSLLIGEERIYRVPKGKVLINSSSGSFSWVSPHDDGDHRVIEYINTLKHYKSLTDIPVNLPYYIIFYQSRRYLISSTDCIYGS